MFCKHAEIFGKPDEGLHKPKLFGFAIVDVLLTIVLAIGIDQYTQMNLSVIIILLLIVSAIVHKAFCVKTKLTGLIFE